MGVFVLLVVLLLGAAIAGTGGFYWLWQGAASDAKTAQSKLDVAVKDIKTLTEQKAAATAELGKLQQTLVQYAEIERLKSLTQAERQKIDDLLKIPSKVDYWKYHKPVDQQDPPFKEPVEQALRKKLEVLQNLSKDIGLWSKPATPPTTQPGTISPSGP
jgi:uncharacterized protein HemX